MVKTGELIEFKSGLFGIDIPNNYGVFIRRFRKKNSKVNFVEIYTIKGKFETKMENIVKKSFGKTIQLRNNQLPDGKEIKKHLKMWISELQRIDKKVESKVSEQLTERALWKTVVNHEGYTTDRTYSTEEIASLWYGLEIDDISKNRMGKISTILNNCRPYGKGYFDVINKNWKPITVNEQKAVNAEISILGGMKNRMFHIVEIFDEEEEEEKMVRKPLPWDEIPFIPAELDLLPKLQNMMAYYVEYNSWDNTGMGNTHIYELDNFSIRTFLSYLAEDWVDEGRTSYADAFVKFLIRSGYWTDTDALFAISRRAVNLASYFDWDTDERIERIAAKYTEPSETPDVFEGRTDLQEMEAYTIDPPTAKDFDDAVSLQKIDNEYILWVHIADVAFYVSKDSSLDLHAKRRATSVYLPTKTLPMLPTRLSDNLCSLREQVPRLAMTVEIHYDNNGNKLFEKCKVHNSVIKVTKNLSYDYVNEAIDRGEEPFVSLYHFSEILQKHRKGLKIQTDDVRLDLGGQMKLSVKTASKSTQMIETFMVAANETVAEILQSKKLPVVYRNHPLPDKAAVERFNMHAKVINFDVNIKYPELFKEEKEEDESILDLLSKGGGGNISFTIGGGTSFADSLKEQLKSKQEEEEKEVDLGTPLAKGLAQLSEDEREAILDPFRKVIDKIETIQDEYKQKLAHLLVLRTLNRAIYNAGNMGHFGLGSTAYLHFTSPIRRYPDIIAHRVCKAMIAEEELAYTAEEIEDIAAHCTEQSEMAEKLERTITGAGFTFLARNPDYTENRMGIVTSISGGGVFITLPNGIEARIPLAKMAGGPTFVDEYESMCFLGSKSDYGIVDEITPENWKDYIDDDYDRPEKIIAKLGDKIAVEFTGWNHVEGRLEAMPIRIISEDED